MENRSKLNKNKEVIGFLVKNFPNCFSIKGEVRPLKIGIFQDLVKRVAGKTSVSKTQLRSALRFYTSSWRYLYSIKAGAIRIDLDGNACSQLNEEHVGHARQKLKKAKECMQKKIQRERIKNNIKNKDDLLKSSEFKIANTQLQVGQRIKITTGKKILNATIIEIIRDNIKVQLTSGLSVTVQAKYLHL